MKIKCLERFSIDGNAYHEGETRVVSDEVGKTAVSNGWAEDLEEDAEKRMATGERSIHPKRLDVQNVKHVHRASKAGG